MLTQDPDLNAVLSNIFQVPGETRSHPYHRIRDIAGQIHCFEDQDLLRLASPTALMNDVCINGGAALMQRRFAALNAHASGSFSILSTHDIPRVRGTCSDSELWRWIGPLVYWEKPVWILPVHRRNHWLLAIIVPEQRQLFLFDSFAEETPWKRDIKVSDSLTTRLSYHDLQFSRT